MTATPCTCLAVQQVVLYHISQCIHYKPATNSSTNSQHPAVDPLPSQPQLTLQLQPPIFTMAHNGQHQHQGWPPRGGYPPPQQHQHNPYAYPPPYGAYPPAAAPAPAPNGPQAQAQPQQQTTYRGAMAQRAPAHHPHAHAHHAPPQYGAYGMPYGVPAGFPYGAPPPHAQAHGYGAPPGHPQQPQQGGGGGAGDLPPGSAPRRISPTSSLDSTMRSIDNAIAPRPMQGAPPGGIGGGGYATQYNFRTGSTISLGSFGDYDLGVGTGVPPVEGKPPAAAAAADAERARKAFNEANKDKSGYVTFREFLQSLADLRLNIAYHDALDKFSKLDIDKDGRVVETEFVNGYIYDKFGSHASTR